jgi:hypothetical protein
VTAVSDSFGIATPSPISVPHRLGGNPPGSPAPASGGIRLADILRRMRSVWGGVTGGGKWWKHARLPTRRMCVGVSPTITIHVHFASSRFSHIRCVLRVFIRTQPSRLPQRGRRPALHLARCITEWVGLRSSQEVSGPASAWILGLPTGVEVRHQVRASQLQPRSVACHCTSTPDMHDPESRAVRRLWGGLLPAGSFPLSDLHAACWVIHRPDRLILRFRGAPP